MKRAETVERNLLLFQLMLENIRLEQQRLQLKEQLYTLALEVNQHRKRGDAAAAKDARRRGAAVYEVFADVTSQCNKLSGAIICEKFDMQKSAVAAIVYHMFATVNPYPIQGNKREQTD